MDFELLQNRLVERLRTQIRNGEITERGLARSTGISQPHMHHVLKGVRTLTPEMGDQILKCLRWSLLDLLDAEELLGYATRMLLDLAPAREISVLAERLGPGQAWSPTESRFERFAVGCQHLAVAVDPVVARLGEDKQLAPLLEAGDLVLLDRSEERRMRPEPNELYAVERCGEVVVRGVRRGASRLYLIAPDSWNRPDRWEPIRIQESEVLERVVARVIPIGRQMDQQNQREAPVASR
ncbi:MAG TPA: hypothetical protein VKV15_15525 [Bryobacteraceae bacterium]|nr:hypothetical protein [Bryobacteraceae bacterium]